MNQTHFGGKSSKDKGFSSKGKIEKYNQDGTETIIVMGRPFRVLQKIDGTEPYASNSKNRNRKNGKDLRSFVFLVENTENLPEFPHHFALRRSFYGVNEVLLAHREPEVLGRVQDKSIVKVYHTEVTRSEGKLGVTVAMEYCSNNLYRRLRPDSRVPEGEIVQVLLAVTSAVGYLHSRQPPIAHRNINPKSILIHSSSTGAASYRLGNFSSAMTEAYHCANREEVAMAVEDIERNTSAGYRAPEMADPGSGKRIDERVDLWSIGVLLYYMMYLRLPFGETNMGLTGRLKLRFPAGTEMWYTGSLRVVLKHLLEPDPDQRWDIFALTNFLRFDEDISKHIGTFFFTATEWPEGWEQQDVKVVNRVAPAKSTPIQMSGPQSSSERGGVSATTAASMSTAYAARTAAVSGRNSPEDNGTEELDLTALEALGIDVDTTDPEMRQYYQMLIQEQKEAWKMVKAANKDSPSRTSGDATAANDKRQPREATPEKEKEEPQQKEEKRDFLDDLFAPAPAPQPTSHSFPDASCQPTMSSNVANDDKNWQATLFSAAPTSQPMPQQQQTQQSYGMMDDGWGTGAPAALSCGGYVGGGMQTAPQMATPSQYIMPQQQQQQPQYMSQWGGAAPTGQQILPVQQQQQFAQQPPMDFTKGDYPQPAKVEPKPEKKKDPFEDLFS